MNAFNIRESVESMLDHDFFGRNKPVELHYEPGEGELLAVTGDNASGKSFFARVLEARSNDRLQVMTCSMERRGKGGFERAVMYGSEEDESTGVLSLKAVMGAFLTCQKRERDHMLILDEPDIGLAESYQHAMGEYIGNFIKANPPRTRALVVITHSRPILAALLPLNPHHVRVGDTRSLKDVVAESRPRTVEELLALRQTGVERYRGIAAVLNDRARKRREAQ